MHTNDQSLHSTHTVHDVDNINLHHDAITQQ